MLINTVRALVPLLTRIVVASPEENEDEYAVISEVEGETLVVTK